MSLQESNSVAPSIIPAVQTGSDRPDTSLEPCGQTGSESFAAAARAILGKDAGLHLSKITGFPERSCYRYASGEREPPAEFLRVLFRSEHGAPFFAAFMYGCDAAWWLDQQRKLRNADKVAALALE